MKGNRNIFIWINFSMGVIFEYKWIPSLRYLVEGISWANLHWWLLGGVAFLYFPLLGWLLLLKVMQSCSQHLVKKLDASAMRFDVFHVKRFGIYFFVGGIVHYVLLFCIYPIPENLFWMWVQIISFFGMLFYNKVIKNHKIA